MQKSENEIHNSGGGLMTQNQLEIVMLLHDRGISHTKIAEMLEVSTTTVKRVCSRIEKERKSTSEQYPICLVFFLWQLYS